MVSVCGTAGSGRLLSCVTARCTPSNMTGGTSVGDVESVAATVKYATIMVATVPILCIYPFLQKYFAAGVMIGAVKE